MKNLQNVSCDVEYSWTSNRSTYNKLRKINLEHKKDGINCSYCSYHQGENWDKKFYGGRKSVEKTYIVCPNWKLVSKNKKQWMKKRLKVVEETSRYSKELTYVEIKF
jgi:hypothetical protein